MLSLFQFPGEEAVYDLMLSLFQLPGEEAVCVLLHAVPLPVPWRRGCVCVASCCPSSSSLEKRLCVGDLMLSLFQFPGEEAVCVMLHVIPLSVPWRRSCVCVTLCCPSSSSLEKKLASGAEVCIRQQKVYEVIIVSYDGLLQQCSEQLDWLQAQSVDSEPRLNEEQTRTALQEQSVSSAESAQKSVVTSLGLVERCFAR